MFGVSKRGRVVKANVESKKEAEERKVKTVADVHFTLDSERQSILDCIAEQRADAAEPQVHYRLDRVAEFIKGRMSAKTGACRPRLETNTP